MKWEKAGPKLSSNDIGEFEASSGRQVPEPVQWLLTHVTNGGWPGSEHWLRVEDPSDDEANLHGVYGINNPGFDLLHVIDHWPRFRGDCWPIGFDDFGGKFLLMLEGQHRGQVRFMPYHMFAEAESRTSFFVAPNIEAFAELLKQPSL